MSTWRSVAISRCVDRFTLRKKRELGPRRKKLEEVLRATAVVMLESASMLLATTRATWLAVNADLHERVASRRVAPSAGVGAPKHAGSWPTNCLKTHWPVLGW